MLFRSEPRFFGHSSEGLYFGVEYELEFPTLWDAQQGTRIVSAANDLLGNPFYLKHDSSLSKYGFEIVSHPFSRGWFDTRYPAEMVQALQGLGAGPTNNYGDESAGIHIHVSKDAFTPYHLYKFLHFHYEFAELVQRVAGRAGSYYASFDRDKNGFVWKYKPNGDMVKSYTSKMRAMASKKDSNPDRYMACNLQNDDTVELRYFRSTAKIERLRAYVQFVDAVYHYTKLSKMSMRAISKRVMSEHDFLSWLRDNAQSYPDTVALFDRNEAYKPE